MEITSNSKAHAKRINGRYQALKGKIFSSSTIRIEILAFSKHSTRKEHRVSDVTHSTVSCVDEIEPYARAGNFQREQFLYVYSQRQNT
jgi:hypothetical protein